MDLEELDFDHPPESVAQRPARAREDARLLVAPPSGPLRHVGIRDLPALFGPGDVLVVNRSRVRPVRLPATKDSGGRAEILLLEQRGGEWLALVGASRAPRPGTRLAVPGGVTLTVAGREGSSFLLVADGDLDPVLERHGSTPLPPYIRRPADPDDADRYQATFARAELAPVGSAASSAAAPTAGLHLTPALLERVRASGAEVVALDLGVGLGTFRAVETPRVEDHRMHDEAFEVPPECARVVAGARRVTAVGTTALRALEAAASPAGRVRPVAGRTGLFLLPGSPFRVVHRLLTNFHQPRTTLMALVQAFAGRARLREVLEASVRESYRVFSYGDAMLLERRR